MHAKAGLLTLKLMGSYSLNDTEMNLLGDFLYCFNFIKYTMLKKPNKTELELIITCVANATDQPQ